MPASYLHAVEDTRRRDLIRTVKYEAGLDSPEAERAIDSVLYWLKREDLLIARTEDADPDHDCTENCERVDQHHETWDCEDNCEREHHDYEYDCVDVALRAGYHVANEENCSNHLNDLGFHLVKQEDPHGAT